jgi:hypothetical protein
VSSKTGYWSRPDVKIGISLILSGLMFGLRYLIGNEPNGWALLHGIICGLTMAWIFTPGRMDNE